MLALTKSKDRADIQRMFSEYEARLRLLVVLAWPASGGQVVGDRD